MREIKFRCWDKKVKFMQEITMLILPNVTEKDGVIAMQYTGLHDKNGKEIYEGDIVKDPNDVIEKVEWDNENVRFNANTPAVLNRRMMDTFEIIGNIYSNPELLTEKA